MPNPVVLRRMPVYRASTREECPICFENYSAAARVQCCDQAHYACRECLQKVVNQPGGDKPCPVCRQYMDDDNLARQHVIPVTDRALTAIISEFGIAAMRLHGTVRAGCSAVVFTIQEKQLSIRVEVPAPSITRDRDNRKWEVKFLNPGTLEPIDPIAALRLATPAQRFSLMVRLRIFIEWHVFDSYKENERVRVSLSEPEPGPVSVSITFPNDENSDSGEEPAVIDVLFRNLVGWWDLIVNWADTRLDRCAQLVELDPFDGDEYGVLWDDLAAAAGSELLMSLTTHQLNKQNIKGETPLYDAVTSDRLAAVKVLLARGAKPDLGKRPRLTRKDQGIVEELIKYGFLNDEKKS